MTLGQVLENVRTRRPVPPEAARREIGGLDYDSRRIGSNFLFFAFSGSRTDGRKFASDALGRGAVAVVSEHNAPEGFGGEWIQVEHGRQALATASRTFYAKPDERICLTGITGTNGKTTTSYLVDSILRAAGKTTALVGTIQYYLAGRPLPALNTTPESLDLCRLLVELEAQGGTHATLEVSSHALALGRVWGFQFHTTIFTNLTRDHLDFHDTMQEYFAAKQQLFSGAGGSPPRFAVINGDDEYGRQIKVERETGLWRYGLGQNAALRARHISSDASGLRFQIQRGKERFDVQSPLIGRMNVYNILAACATGLTYGIDPATIRQGIAQCRSVPGRFERVDQGQPFVVVVDYAHTDDALRNTLSVARGLSSKRVLTLFGCGGDRDRSKRPLMGQVAAELSDFVVLTSDNPRSEDPLAIMNDALVGLRRKDVPHLIEPDRAAAIRAAINEAQRGDIVVLAGKGHETYQILKHGTIHFDDREVAREVLHSFGYRLE